MGRHQAPDRDRLSTALAALWLGTQALAVALLGQQVHETVAATQPVAATPDAPVADAP